MNDHEGKLVAVTQGLHAPVGNPEVTTEPGDKPISERSLGDYETPASVTSWLHARLGRKVYVRTVQGDEFAGRVARSPAGTVRLASFHGGASCIAEADITGVLDAPGH